MGVVDLCDTCNAWSTVDLQFVAEKGRRSFFLVGDKCDDMFLSRRHMSATFVRKSQEQEVTRLTDHDLAGFRDDKFGLLVLHVSSGVDAQPSRRQNVPLALVVHRHAVRSSTVQVTLQTNHAQAQCPNRCRRICIKSSNSQVQVKYKSTNFNYR